MNGDLEQRTAVLRRRSAAATVAIRRSSRLTQRRVVDLKRDAAMRCL